jgi:hypothetical protein
MLSIQRDTFKSLSSIKVSKFILQIFDTTINILSSLVPMANLNLRDPAAVAAAFEAINQRRTSYAMKDFRRRHLQHSIDGSRKCDRPTPTKIIAVVTLVTLGFVFLIRSVLEYIETLVTDEVMWVCVVLERFSGMEQAAARGREEVYEGRHVQIEATRRVEDRSTVHWAYDDLALLAASVIVVRYLWQFLA